MIKLFTHTDLDGVACAVLAKLAFGDDVDIEYCNYDDIDNRVLTFMSEVRYSEIDAVYITDISVNEDTAKLMEDTRYSDVVKLFDHHKTAERLNKYDWCDVSEFDGELGFKTCGTEMFYKYLIEADHLKDTDRHHTFVWAVRNYDTWEWKNCVEEDGKMIKEFNDLLYILGRDEFIERCIKRFKGNKNVVNPGKDERMLLDRRQAEIDAYISKKEKELETIGYINSEYGVVFADRFVSELGNTLCERHPEIDYIVMIDPGSMKVSLRSVKDDVDVGAIAKEKGGGGHKAAAGYHFDWKMLSIMIEAALKNIIVAEEVDVNRDEIPQPKKSWFDRFKKKLN